MIRPRPGSRAGSRVPRVPSEEQLARTGAAMRRIRSSRVNLDWLQGPGPTDLWIWREIDADRADLVELTFHGRSVILRGEALSTGRCEHGTGSPYAQELGLLEMDPVLDPVTLAAAETLLGALPAEIRNPTVETLIHAIREARERDVREAPKTREEDEGPNI